MQSRKTAKYWELGLDHEIGQEAVSWLRQNGGRLELAQAKWLWTVKQHSAHVDGSMGQDTRTAGGVGSAVSFSDDEDTTQFTGSMSASRGRKGSTVPFRSSHDSEEVAIAGYIFGVVQEFDGIYGPGWQCIVGTDFGSFVTHCYGCFIHFCIGNLAILLFRGSACPETEATQFSTLEAVKA
ncbi:hypothetical protein RHMOL_Rhmol04G0032500 [Rhododendron molle]|uniref:Uncharacterized protein n=1 Tax=Rhododendron molle TaxID=49168 RepID=A0ACC0NWU8_RHOML|nr:hypothetical protein RHMOL_Rhmol04G0032500 [Rhododendron molle]